MKFRTVSGSEYEIDDGFVRRINTGVEKRADGEWIRLHNNPQVYVGASVIMEMDSLRDFGYDDNYTPWADSGSTTLRTTSIVTEIHND